MTRKDLGLLLLILFLGAGLTLHQKCREAGIPLNFEVDGLELLEGPAFAFEETRESDFPAGGRLEISARRGEVQVHSWDKPRVRIRIRKQVHAESQKAAARIGDLLALEMVPSGAGLVARVATRDGSNLPPGLETDYTVLVPRNSRLSVLTSHGDVLVGGIRGDVTLRTSHGKVEATEIDGPCEIVNRHGAVTVREVSGALTVSTEHDDVEVSDVQGPVEVTSAHGAVSVTKAAGRVIVRARHGEVTVSEVGQSVRVEAPHCNVTIRSIRGGAAVSLEGDTLEAEAVGGPVEVRAEAASVRLVDVEGRIRLEGRHTDVRLVRPGSDADVRTTHQAIDLVPRSGHGFRLNATAEKGEIESDLPKLILPEEPVASFSGVVGDGKSFYRLSTTYSTIRIHPPGELASTSR